MYCTSCGNKLPDTGRFCSHCGKAIEQGDPDATVLGEAALLDGNLETIAPSVPSPQSAAVPNRPPSQRPRSAPSSNPTLTSSDPIGGGRFAPGTVLLERYRIVALLGRGGMGEVYRAEDLRLSQVLAIKFLPEAFANDQAALVRFHSEVRVARQVSHPNVCRVFDIGDVDGLPFLTMEYVDGEDLSSLIRRIGRLPQDKAMEVSRQICAGLAAAHERGVIHRDLKPANVMLDGAGKARITDFGLAGIAADLQGSELRAGTPAYMAPEQLAGKEVTVKSDIYSLGLLMYELLTGRRVFNASTMAELMKSREEGAIANPSTIVKDLDPLLEHVILRCLDADPAKRPSSALQVAAALPGGDPLAAALAAGETPSPEMVAAAGAKEGIKPIVAASCLVAVIALLIVGTYLGVRESGLRQVNPQYSPEIMSHKAREIVESLGYPAEAKDTASGYSYNIDYLSFLENKEKPGSFWNRALAQRPSVLEFWFRQSPKELTPNGFSQISLTPGVVTATDPPVTFSGMINLTLDPKGRLLYFQAIPPQKAEPASATETPNWAPLFAAAQIDSASLRATPPVWNSLAASDIRAAWDGVWPGTTRPLHVEAAAWQGRPVYFLLAGPWTIPARMPPPPQAGSEAASRIFGTTLAILVIAGGVSLAYRNYARGKSDRRGALRLAAAVFLLEMLLFFVSAHLFFSFQAIGLSALALSTGLFVSAILWILYMALEPYVRSKWPQTIVSWSRLLAGNWKDPMVGRDVLYGAVLGLGWMVVFYLGYALDVKVGEQPLFPGTELLEGIRTTIAIWLGNIVMAMVGVLSFFFVLVLLRVLLRNRWVAAVVFVALFTLPKVLGSEHPLIETPIWIVIYGIAAFAIVRFGLVTLAVAVFTANVLLNLPHTADLSKWYAPEAISVLLSFVLLALWGFRTALAGQHLLKGELFD